MTLSNPFPVLMIFFVAFIASCTSTYRLPETKSFLVTDRPMPGLDKIRYRFFKVESSKQGGELVANSRTYLIDLFRQSTEPYFGVDRWSSDCLRRNSIGPIENHGPAVYFKSSLTSNPSLMTGFCTENSIDASQIVGHCDGDGQSYFYEITATGKKSAKISYKCPGTLVVPN